MYLGSDYLKLSLQAVANSTSATFLRVVGSELIQKYLGDGPKLVRELFRVADELSPSIVFIDEIDAVGTKRYDAHSGGEREIQRLFLDYYAISKFQNCFRITNTCNLCSFMQPSSTGSNHPGSASPGDPAFPSPPSHRLP